MSAREAGPMVAGINLAVLAAMGVSVAVQHNDPDPWAWMLFYGLGVVACLAFHFGRLPWQAAATLSLLAGGTALWLLPQFIGEVEPADILASLGMKTRAVEEAREAGGALLLAIWMGVLALVSRHLSRKRPA